MNEASCLSLLSNAVTAWNIVEMTRIVEELRRAANIVADAEIAHVWPLSRAHVGAYGHYRFTPPSAPN